LRSTRRPKLGQHFLSSGTYVRRIAEALPVWPDDLVIEIGPGRGAMTGVLAEQASRVVAVELDSELARGLERQFASGSSVEVIEADILQVDIGEICRRHNVAGALIFGNLPYYITSPILHHLLEFPERIRALACVVQLEVAERITAQPGTRAYGYLSVLAQFHSIPHLRFRIPPGAFSPAPAVSSALVTFEMLTKSAAWDEPRRGAFLDFAKQGFGQKRKTLVNNLAAQYGGERTRSALRALGFSDNVRAEELGVLDLGRLFDELGPERL
jgi:16S rRNA (adenine1518-N6/adenine1519-N6)-dimethyltransferase